MLIKLGIYLNEYASLFFENLSEFLILDLDIPKEDGVLAKFSN